MSSAAICWWLWRTAWRGQYALRAAAALAALILAAALAAAPQLAEVTRELALATTLHTRSLAAPDLRLTLPGLPLESLPYQAAAEDLDRAARDALGGAPVDQLRTVTTAQLLVAAPGRPRPDDEFPRPAPAATPAASSPAELPQRAVLRARAGLDTRVAYLSGQRPPGITGLPEVIPVAVGSDTAAGRGLAVGRRLDLHPTWNPEARPMTVEVVAIIAPDNPADAYWQGTPGLALDGPPDAVAPLVLHVPEATFFGALDALLPGGALTLEATYRLGTPSTPATAGATLDALRALEARLAASDLPATVESPLPALLDRYRRAYQLGTGAALLVAAQLAGLAAFAVRTLALEARNRRAPTAALLEARGAAPALVRGLWALDAALLVAPAAALAPLAGGAALAALGRAQPLARLTGDAFLDPSPNATAWLLGAAGAAVGLLLLVLPPGPALAPERRRTAAAAALAAALSLLGWAALAAGPLLATDVGRPELRLDRLMLPATVIAAVALVAAACCWLAAAAGQRGRAVHDAAEVAPRSLALVTAAIALTVATATATPALRIALDAAPAFAVGGDVRTAGPPDASPSPAEARARSAALRTTGRVVAGGASLPVRLLGVESSATAWSDPAVPGAATTAEVAQALATNSTAAREPSLLAGARFVGAWIKLPELRDTVTIGVQLRAAGGTLVDVPLTTVLPGQIPTSEWSFFAAELTALPRELALAAVTVTASSGAPGTLLLGPVVATTASGVATRGGGGRVPFAGGTIVEEFATPTGWEPLPAPDGTPGGLLGLAAEAPPGAAAATRLDWRASAAASGSVRSGLRPGDGAPVLLYLDRAIASALGLAPGDSAELELAGRRARAQVGGTLRAFPGLDDPPGTEPDPPGFAVADLGRLLAVANAAPAGVTLAANETWWLASDPAALRSALQRTDPALSVIDRSDAAPAVRPGAVLPAAWAGVLRLAALAASLLAAAVLLLAGGPAVARAIAVAAGAALGLAAGIALQPAVIEAVRRSASSRELAPLPIARLEWWPVAATLALLAIAAFAPLAARARVRRPRPALGRQPQDAR